MYLTRQERNGLFVVVFISSLISFAPLIYSFFEKKKTTDFSTFINEIQVFQKADIYSQPLAFPKNKFSKITPRKQFNLFYFDPNSASEEDFINLGISPKTTNTIINYRNKGAMFFKKEDFKTWLRHFNLCVDEKFVGQKAEMAKTRALSIATVMEIKMIKS